MGSTSDKPTTTASTGFTDRERAAMKARAAELKKEASSGRGKKAAADEADVLEKIEQMVEPDRSLAARVHAIVTENAPDLAPKLWYAQPAYARKGKVVCFFRSGHDDGERYSSFGFTPEARLDDGALWPTSYAVTAVDEKTERTIAALVRKAATG